MSNATLESALSAEPARTRDRLALHFALTVFVSAFLLFQIEPLISKFILPWFGGSPAVWTTCLLFFQVVLFCGYAYAHLSTRFLAPRARVIVHCAAFLNEVKAAPPPDARSSPPLLWTDHYSNLFPILE